MNLFRIPKTKKTYLDVIKLLAIGMVVFNHSGNNGYKMYLDVLEGPAHQLMLCWSAFIKIAASLFFCWEAYGRKGTMSVPDFLLHLYRNDLTGHLWYLYSYLCYLLLVIVYQAAQLLPAADYALFRGTAAHTSYISFFVAADYVVYPLLGHYIDSLTEKEEREETVCILLFLSILAVFLTSVLMDWRCGVDGGWTNAKREAYMGRLSVFPAITVFYCVRKLFARLPVKNGLANVLFILGSCTFGVYLFDPKWRQLTQSVRTLLTPSIGLYFATHVQTICACLPGLAATFLFKCVTGGAGLLAGTFDDGCESDQGAAAGINARPNMIPGLRKIE